LSVWSKDFIFKEISALFFKYFILIEFEIFFPRLKQYSLPNIVRVVKSRRMRWAGHVARMGVCTGFWWGNLRERDHWGDPDVDGRIILRWILRKWERVVGTGWSWIGIGTGGGHL
jgi:hypothetical protein